MGIIQSIFCSMTFCVERVLTWTCCAFLLMLLMFCIVMLMVYGISVGYHYAQKELASFAMSSRSTTEMALLRAGPENRPVVRLLAVNRSEVEHAPHPLLEGTCWQGFSSVIYSKLKPYSTFKISFGCNRSEVDPCKPNVNSYETKEVYQTKKPGENIFIEQSETPIVLLETERPPKAPELSPHEREFARRLIGRFRRSRNNTSTAEPFLRPLRFLNSTQAKTMPLI